MTTNDGKSAEAHVAALYRALGYEVEQNRLVQGCQIDVIARRRIPGLGDTTVGIEVKDHPAGSLPIGEVREFVNVAKPLIEGGHFTQMCLITTGQITPNSVDFITPIPDLRLRTLTDLERDLFDPTPALRRWQQLYASRPDYNRFIDLRATLLENDAGDDVEAPGRLPATDLLTLAGTYPSSAVIVLADYGSGKTTALERIKHRAIEAFLLDDRCAVPILIRLREVETDFDVESLALRAAERELNIHLAGQHFWDLRDAGRFLFLLDGFDEITLRATSATRADLLARISPLLFSSSPAILTSRPSYFSSLTEYRTLLHVRRTGRETSGGRSETRIDRLVDRYRDVGPTTPLNPSVLSYQLDALTDDQINSYLDGLADELSKVGTTPDQVRSFIRRVYDLSDLIERPIILDMVVSSVLEGDIDPAREVLVDGPAGLYETYTQAQLGRDWANVASRSQFLTLEVRTRFAEECALHMWTSDSLVIGGGEVTKLVERTIRASDSHDKEELLTDLRTCSFLTVDREGNLEFIHRSFQEFFVARRLRSDVAAGSEARLRRPLRSEYLYFLGSYASTNDSMHNALVAMARSNVRDDATTAAVADNAAHALLVARDHLRGITWSQRQVIGLRRPSVALTDAKLRDVRLAELKVAELTLNGSELDVSIDAAEPCALTLTNCSGSVRTSGRVASVGVVGGRLTAQFDEGTSSIVLDNSDVALRAVSPPHGPMSLRCTGVSGSLSIGPTTIAMSGSTVGLNCDGVLTGSIAASTVEVPLATFASSVAASLNDSLLIVKGLHHRRSLAETTRRRRQLTDVAGSNSVVLLDPAFDVDDWWRHQDGLVSVGGTVSRTAPCAGVFVRHEPRGRVERDGVEVDPAPGHEGAIVFSGRGSEFEGTVRRLRDVVSTASVQRSTLAQWASTKLAPILIGLGAPEARVAVIVGLLGRFGGRNQ